MTAKLSEDLVQELERVGDVPLRVENPRNHKLYLIVAEDRFPIVGKDNSRNFGNGEWTGEQNARRFMLIDKEIAGTLSPAETMELQRLQQGIDGYLRHVAPHSLAAARDLHEQLRRSLGNFTES